MGHAVEMYFNFTDSQDVEVLYYLPISGLHSEAEGGGNAPNQLVAHCLKKKRRRNTRSAFITRA